MPSTALSPSRAADFMQCPLLYRFRVVDRLPEAPSPAAVRGTVVHAVLERLFDLPAEGRTLEAAHALVEPQWQRVREAEPELTGLFDGDAAAVAGWLTSAQELVTPLVRPGGPHPARAGRPRALRRDHPRRRPDAARVRRPARRRG
jgi:putative RecB family exonuclease